MLTDQYRSIVESAEDPIFISDADGRYIYVNGAAAATFGLTPQEVTGKTADELFPPHVAAGYRAGVRQVIDSGTTLKSEDKSEIAGVEKWFSTVLQPLRDANGKVIAVLGMVRDVTSAKQVELALLASEERLRQVVRASNIGIFDLDFEHKTAYWSPEQRAIWGISADEPVSWDQQWPRMHPDDRDKVRAAIDRAHHSADGVFEIEHRILIPGGAERSVTVTAQTFFTGEGDARRRVRTIGATRDITGVRRAEDALRASEERLRQAVRVSNIGIFDLDFTAQTVYWSPQQRVIRGWGADEPVGWGQHLDQVHPDDRAQVDAAIARVQASAHGVFEVEHRIIRRDGSVRWLVTRGQNVFEGEGADRRTVRAIGAVRDITAERLAEIETAELQAKLQQVQKLESIGRLAGGIAHDFNNILNIIIGCAEMAEMEMDPSAVREYLAEILKASRRSADLTRQLLGFARRQTALPRVVDLNDFVSASLKMLRRLIGEHITLSWHLGIDLWPVRVDPVQIDQILVNLVANARDAIADVGGVVIHTENISADMCAKYPGLAPGEYVRLAVVDNGQGMDRETQRHLFEPFYTTKGPGHGTGLGMASVDGIVRQNQGAVTVTSTIGQGTTVNVFLPRIAAPVSPDVVITQEAPKGGTETVLVVEDEPALLQLAVRALGALGYNVLSAASPDEAIAIAIGRTGPLDILVTDIVMPGMNGRNLAEHLVAAMPQLKCLFMSGYTNGVIGADGKLDEHVHFLQKPFSPRALTDKVRQVLEA